MQPQIQQNAANMQQSVAKYSKIQQKYNKHAATNAAKYSKIQQIENSIGDSIEGSIEDSIVVLIL